VAFSVETVIRARFFSRMRGKRVSSCLLLWVDADRIRAGECEMREVT